jgi:thymidylate synthase
MLAFVTSVDSQFYPEIGPLYEARIRTWAAEELRGNGIDQHEEVVPKSAQGRSDP